MIDGGTSWYEDDYGPSVRPFAVTRGRVRVNRGDLDMLTLVRTVHPDAHRNRLQWEHNEILLMCVVRPLSLVEISARLDLLLAAVKVLVGDLLDVGALVLQSPARPVPPNPELLQAVLDGVRRL
ncbi:DUF742 domain-containing protein [Amycolatopsis balhimycina DSM 5908]|uniref:DUF742 domain-containing protein n=1 Tax=Amycolatopsis balhimycina DSM 5908 TaxID=1081091 RepID=A0A428X6E7_AMYBA|nr:DUF742 domain-containing protein [Amycolatopsis balhimycina]RSM50893.1 DUF742 domain-containing protein [Amycolatopsis balhimycina DSM 5908]